MLPPIGTGCSYGWWCVVRYWDWVGFVVGVRLLRRSRVVMVGWLFCVVVLAGVGVQFLVPGLGCR